MPKDTKQRRMKVVSAITTRAGLRLIVEDLDAGERFRWLPGEFIKELIGREIEDDWTTYSHAGYAIAHRAQGSE
ncbi:hypothetical protein ACWDYH_00495 [Nocardia goodfellowii]